MVNWVLLALRPLMGRTFEEKLLALFITFGQLVDYRRCWLCALLLTLSFQVIGGPYLPLS